MNSQPYDFIFAGGGLAGLSLAYRISQSDLRDSSMLIIDRDAKNRNDRTWCFWTNHPTGFDEIVYRSWDRLRLASENFEKEFSLDDYQYQMIRGIDFYRFVQTELSARGNVEFLQGCVDCITDDADGMRVSVGDKTYLGKWAFDSRFNIGQFTPDTTRYHSLQQHFEGWRIETPHSVFDPGTATLFDFRTEQKNELRFFYVLPLSEHEALVEYVLPSPDDYDQAMRNYLENVLAIRDYRIVAREGGINPLTDFVFPRRIGQHTLAIGTNGGRVKPTSGYAFVRIQHDCATIVDSLAHYGHPFHLLPDSRYYRLCDSLMLQLMYRQGAEIKSLFTTLFQNNPAARVLRFLDETASPWENLELMASLPPGLFLQALFRTKILRQI